MSERIWEKGTRVKTVAVESPSTDWTEEGKRSRKFGITGSVITHHDSHGFCYDVRHDDGTDGCYDPEELELLGDREDLYRNLVIVANNPQTRIVLLQDRNCLQQQAGTLRTRLVVGRYHVCFDSGEEPCWKQPWMEIDLEHDVQILEVGCGT